MHFKFDYRFPFIYIILISQPLPVFKRVPPLGAYTFLKFMGDPRGKKRFDEYTFSENNQIGFMVNKMRQKKTNVASIFKFPSRDFLDPSPL